MPEEQEQEHEALSFDDQLEMCVDGHFLTRVSPEAARAVRDAYIILKTGWLPEELDRQDPERLQTLFTVWRMMDRAAGKGETSRLRPAGLSLMPR